MSEKIDQVGPPEKASYLTEDDLTDEFCQRVGCSDCHSTMPESYEPCGYGCSHMEEWVEKYMDSHVHIEDQ